MYFVLPKGKHLKIQVALPKQFAHQFPEDIRIQILNFFAVCKEHTISLFATRIKIRHVFEHIADIEKVKKYYLNKSVMCYFQFK